MVATDIPKKTKPWFVSRLQQSPVFLACIP